jgi:Flp pilus assembly protein TadD
MEKLEPPEMHYLSAAAGWVGLGNLVEAEAELGRIGAARQQHPDVLEVRWALHAEQKKWAEALQVARQLIHAVPEEAAGWLHQAYAMRRAPGGGLQRAWEALLAASEKFPREPLVAFNLACYACQMGRLEEARAWLKRASEIAGKEIIKRQALGDEDLKPLWEEIKLIGA